ncbi:MAG: ABC transporter ATP-binding protein [Bacteroidia bacterium]
MKLLFSYLKNFKFFVFLALLLAAINQVFSLLDPVVGQKIIDQYIVPKNGRLLSDISREEFIRGVSSLILLAISVAMISRIAKAFQDYYVNVIVKRVGAQIYSDGLRHSLELPYSVFEDQRSGETLGKLQKVREDVERLGSAFINIIFTSFVGIVFVITLAVIAYWPLAVIYFVTIPLIGTLSYFLSKKIKVMQKKIVKETIALSGSTTESLRNIELVKSLGLAQQETERLNGTTEKILKLELKKVRYLRSLSFVQGTFINLLRNSILFILLYLVYTGKISFGDYFKFFIFSFFIFGPLQELGSIINIYREAEVSLDNFQAILDTPRDPKPENPVTLPEIHKLEFRDVDFKHLTASHNAIEKISFRVNVGETIAFVGPSGSGKSTLVKLLVGLYKPLSGAIFYNDHPGSSIDLDKMREQIGMVTQDTQLFSGTIRENLLFVAPKATDEECIEVLNKAACQSLLARADKGLDSVIGEGGVKVSGGEKQRLSIARALLRRPSLLVFDEATSSLDSITEEEIGKTVRDVSKSKKHITILVAHRLSTIMHADKIFVLEKGHIIESGKHEELLNEKGLYYAMWRQQIGERMR